MSTSGSAISSISRTWCSSDMGHHARSYMLVFIVLLLAYDFCNATPLSLEDRAYHIARRTALVSRRSLGTDGLNSTKDAANILLAFRRALTTESTEALKSWNLTTTPNFCKWVGVTCNQAGNVSALNLTGKGLAGNISPSLGSLSSLSSLNLSRNSLSGPIPRTFGSLRKLTYLDLSSNRLSGNIPVEISNCSALIQVSLSKNNLSGGIPSEIGKLKSVALLDLSVNQLTRSIPRSLGNCSLLQHLILFDNDLSGLIPTDLGNLRKLKSLNATSNSLAGQIPRSLVNCSSLETLGLNNNNLIGHILPELGILRRLIELRLDGTFLTGPIPKSLGNLSSLEVLALGGPFYIGVPKMPLTGNLPAELAKLHNLHYLWISFTNITGHIPPQLGNMTSLQYLYMAGNLVTGTVPESFGNLKRLLTLELDGNRLTGKIPPILGNLKSLGWLGLRLNHFIGGVPASFGNLTNVWRLLVSNNMLTGPFPPELGNLTKVGQLGLDNNAFTGELPATVGNLVNIESLYLQNNFFSGRIPPSLFSAMKVSFELHLDNNNFSGNIPREVGDMIILQVMNLSFNNLSGPIPEEIVGCMNLQNLSLSNNHLTGELPVRALETMNLTEFSVANNNLEGPVPPSVGAFAKFDASAYAGNPGLCGPLFAVNCSNTSSSNPEVVCSGISTTCHRGWFYGLIAAGFSVFVLLLGVCIVIGFFCCCKTSSDRLEGVHDVGKDYMGTWKDAEEESLFTKDFTKKLTVEELRSATNGFSDANTLGVGGQSIVFKAVLPDPDGKTIAVKVLNANLSETSMIDALLNEVKVLANIRHRNLVSLYGFCANPDIKALLVEYVENGTLHSHLHARRRQGVTVKKCSLSLENRLRIAVGVADALSYLHHECRVPVIHRDMKPSNILLDFDFNPKVSDFGISKHVKPGYQNEVSASYLCGTIGYIPPEYATTNRVSTEGDVYSYGIILLELLTGKSPTDGSFANGDTLVSWVFRVSSDSIGDVLDDALGGEIPSHEEQLQMLLRVGLMCTRQAAKSRPSMREVREVLRRVQAEGTASLPEAKSAYPTWEELARQPSAELGYKHGDSKHANDPARAWSPDNVSASNDRGLTNPFL